MTISHISVMSPSLPMSASQQPRKSAQFAASLPQQPKFGSDSYGPSLKSPKDICRAAAALALLFIGALIHERVANDGQTFLGMPTDLTTPLAMQDAPKDVSVLHFQGFTAPRLAQELKDVKLMHNADGVKIYHFKLAGVPNSQFKYTTAPTGAVLEELEKGGPTAAWGVLTEEGNQRYLYELRYPSKDKATRTEESPNAEHVKYFQSTFKALEARLGKAAEVPPPAQKVEKAAPDNAEQNAPEAKPAEPKEKPRAPQHRGRTMYA